MSFKYFGYGSNLSGFRLSQSCPSLKKHSIGKLHGYTVSFGKFSDRWKGGVASLKESQNPIDHVWGVVWDIDVSEQAALDVQEGVKIGYYRSLDVVVETAAKEKIKCRTYQLTDLGGLQEYADPSPQYHGVIVDGAIENELPLDYISKLKSIKTNGNQEITSYMQSVIRSKIEL